MYYFEHSYECEQNGAAYLPYRNYGIKIILVGQLLSITLNYYLNRFLCG